MPQLEQAPPAQRRAGPLPAQPQQLAGWGGGPPVPASVWRPSQPADLAGELRRMAEAGERTGVIARGLGRAYGDAAQLRRGLVVQTGALRGWELDAQNGLLTAQAGVSAAELMRELIPRGFVLPVLPGTQHVSIGGMIASDVHGKNHGVAGSFARHVPALGLLRSDGELVELRPGDEGFAATAGGMGLTGVIAWAQVKLARVAGPMMSVDTDRAVGLEAILELLRAPGKSHRVAWLDLLGGGVRGVVTRAQFAGEQENAAAHRRADVAQLATVPRWWPGGLPRLGVRAFNELRFRTSPTCERDRLEPVGQHMFPLDRLGAWPRLYGPAGFVQYQLVVPFGAERTLELVLETLDSHRVPCFLAVLKDFGEASDAPLSFPMPGWTLALDLPRSAPALLPALRRCDELVVQAGGRVYLSKDARLAPDVLGAMYPRLEQWREARARLDPLERWRSDLGLRLGLVDPPPAPARRQGAPAAGATAGDAIAAAAPATEAPIIAAPATQPHAAAAPATQPPAAAAPATHASAAAASATQPPAPQRVLMLGGSSEIALAILRRLARERQLRALLLGRSPQRLAAAAEQLRREGVQDADCLQLDALELDRHEAALADAFQRLGGCDLAILALGVLGAQQGIDADPAQAREVLEVNVLGAGMLMLALLRRLREQGHGTLVVLSSVAAERARAGNAVYGAAKAALDALAQGLGDSLAGSGVRVMVVRPGFVHTRMTAGLAPAPLATSADAVAEATIRGLARGADTVWAPATLRYVFSLLRHLPRPLYRRLPL